MLTAHLAIVSITVFAMLLVADLASAPATRVED
jgi:hypothetical protein